VDRDRRHRRQRASAIVLLPAAVLIVVMLGGIAVDATIAFLGRHELDDAVAAAASDAATAGLDRTRFGRDGTYVLDPAEAERVVRASLGARRDAVVERALAEGHISVQVESTDDPTRPASVTVSAVSSVDLVFTRAVPGLSSSVTVRASATATAVLTP